MGQALVDFQEIQAQTPLFWTGLLFIIGLVESKGIANGWQSPKDVAPGSIAGIRDDYITGEWFVLHVCVCGGCVREWRGVCLCLGVLYMLSKTIKKW